MFRRKTLFVVGAGASAEFGLPLGTLLARQITNKMDIRFERGLQFVGSGDQRLYEQLVQSKRVNPDQWQPAAMRIRDGLPFAQSIDDFLDQRRSDSWVNLYGKSATLAAQIKTYTEQVDEETILNKIRAFIGEAESVVFLEFAYHSQNMQMLRTADRSGKVAYGTAFGMSNPDIDEVRKSIAQTLAPSAINVDGVKCAGLFDNYVKSLTGGD
jgi:hypothetical protein